MPLTASLPMYNLPEMRAVNAAFWAALRQVLAEAGVASPEALYCQPTAPEHAESVDRLERVVGTGRMESACGTEKRAHGPLVYSNQERGNEAHCSLWSHGRRVKLARYALPKRAQALA